MKYIIDSYAWIEYLEGSKAGEKVNQIINSDNEIYILPITIAELVSKAKRRNSNHQLMYESVIKSKILNISPKIAREAGLLHAEMRKKFDQFGIVDAILISTAKEIKAKIITGDNHFKQFKEAIII